MELLNYRNKDFLDLIISSATPANSLTRLSETNKESLKELVKYLSRLRAENIISQNQFSGLVSLACANYIENEVEMRISKSINDKVLFMLEKL